MNIEDAEKKSARPGRPKSETKRERISEAAARLFLTEGFERTSMDSIAGAAGVSKQTVYSHFQNKDELFRSCIAGKIRQYALALDPTEHDSLESGLAALADGYLRLLSDARVISMWRLVVTEASLHPRVAEMFYQTGPGTTLHSLADFLSHHGQRLVNDDYLRLAGTFIALTTGHYQTQIMLGIRDAVPDAERAEHVERVTRQFLTLFKRD